MKDYVKLQKKVHHQNEVALKLDEAQMKDDEDEEKPAEMKETAEGIETSRNLVKDKDEDEDAPELEKKVKVAKKSANQGEEAKHAQAEK